MRPLPRLARVERWLGRTTATIARARGRVALLTRGGRRSLHRFFIQRKVKRDGGAAAYLALDGQRT